MRMPLDDLLQRHGLSQKRVAVETGLPISTVSDVVNRKREPRTGTVNKLLAFARCYEPAVSYEELFAPELIRGAAA